MRVHKRVGFQSEIRRDRPFASKHMSIESLSEISLHVAPVQVYQSTQKCDSSSFVPLQQGEADRDLDAAAR